MRGWPQGSEGAERPNVGSSTLMARLIALAGALSVALAGCSADPGAGGSGSLAISARWERRTADQTGQTDSCAGFDSGTEIPADVRLVRVVVQSDPTDPTQPTSCCRVDVENPRVNRQVSIRQLLQGLVTFKVDAFDAVCNVPLAPDDLCGSAESVESCATAGAAPTPVPTMCTEQAQPSYSSGEVNEVLAAGETKRVGVCMRFLGTTATVTATPTVTDTPTITATVTLTPTNTGGPTSTDTATATATGVTGTPTVSHTPSRTVTFGATTSATATATRTGSVTATVTDTPATGTATPTTTSTPSATATETPNATATDTPATVTATATTTDTGTVTA